MATVCDSCENKENVKKKTIGNLEYDLCDSCFEKVVKWINSDKQKKGVIDFFIKK